MNYNPFSLNEKTILVTGASSGIGQAIAIECSKAGANVIVTGRRSTELEKTLNQLSTGENRMIIADLVNEEDLLKLVHEVPVLDGVVHCAGVVKTVPFQFISRNSLNELFEINSFAPAMLSVQLLKKRKIVKGSSIVFISSISGVSISIVGNTLYSASKGAINGLMKNMALELASQGIRVNSVNPGMVETTILKDGKITAEQLDQEARKYPLKRFGRPEEVAYAVIYLLSEASNWVTGTSLTIDGGFTLL